MNLRFWFFYWMDKKKYVLFSQLKIGSKVAEIYEFESWKFDFTFTSATRSPIFKISWTNLYFKLGQWDTVQKKQQNVCKNQTWGGFTSKTVNLIKIFDSFFSKNYNFFKILQSCQLFFALAKKLSFTTIKKISFQK